MELVCILAVCLAINFLIEFLAARQTKRDLKFFNIKE